MAHRENAPAPCNRCLPGLCDHAGDGAAALPAEFFRLVVETQSEAIVAIDRRGRVVYFSRGAEKLFGFGRGQIVGQSVSTLMPPDTARAHDDYLNHHLTTGEQRIIGRTREVVGLTADGRRVPLDLRVVRLDVAGEAMFLGTMRDVSDRKTREAALATLAQELGERNARIDAAFSNISEGVSLFDAELRLICANRRYSELAGLPDSAIRPGMSFQSILELAASFGLVDDSEAGDWMERRLALVRSREPGVLIRQLRGGRTVRIAHSPLADGRALETVSDITDMEQTARALQAAVAHAEAANRAKSEFLANMSHELRTPLNAIIGLSEALTLSYLGPLTPKQREYLGDVHAAGTHLLQIINDLLDLAKIEAGRYQIRIESCDAVELAQEALRLVRPLASENGVVLEENVAAAAMPLKADERAVRQILLNLLSNAVKFTPRGGTVTLAIEAEADGEVVFAVSDTGIGMSEAELAIAVQPFGQVQTAYTRRHAGTGLGLPLTRLLTELHHGRFAITSRQGEGTRVSIHLPVAISGAD